MKLKKIMSTALIIGVFCTGAGNVLAKGSGETDSAGFEKIHLPADRYIIDSAVADITGDGANDNLYLIGHKEKKSDIFAKELSIIVRDGANNAIDSIDLDGFTGYEGKLFVGDFTGDAINDVMVSAATGGSGGIVGHVIVNYNDPEAKIIFNEKNNQGAKFTGNFVEGFKAQLVNENTGRSMLMDLANKRDFYVQSAVYDKDGKLLKEVKPISYPFTVLEPIDVDRDGVYELKGIQRIIGAYGADGIGNIYSFWKYENKEWKVKRIEVSSFLL